MISPAEIQEKQFTRGVRGYKEEEVDEFLGYLVVELGQLIGENNLLKESIRSLQTEVERYRSSEHAILETLESAKGLMSDISVSAEKRADVVLKNAELDAERIIREARESVEHITEDAVKMAARWDRFQTQFKNLLQNELDRFDGMSEDLIGNPDKTGFYADDSVVSPPISTGLGDDYVTDKTIKTFKRNGQ